jgi:ferric-dicitrate binding protein FerR (iron transport regulator)
MSDQDLEEDAQSGSSAEEEDPIADLLARAGPRTPVPQETAARVREAVHGHWRRSLDARHRRQSRRILAIAAVAAFAVVAAGTWSWLVSSRQSSSASAPAGRPVTIANVEAVSGNGLKMVVRGTDRPLALLMGRAVSAGAAIVTSQTGRVALRTLGGASVRVDVSSRLRVLSPSDLVLESGALYIDNPPGVPGRRRIEVRTPQGWVFDEGTQFEIRVGPSGLRVRVREGAVVVHRDITNAHAVGGEVLRLDSTGAVERGSLPPYGPEWAWVTELAPAPVIEGRRLGKFLEWVERESGWQVRFTDPSVARASAGVVLHGSIDGLTPATALATVLPTCGFSHRVRDGVVWIDEASGRSR